MLLYAAVKVFGVGLLLHVYENETLDYQQNISDRIYR